MSLLQRIGLIVAAICLIFSAITPGYAQDSVGNEDSGLGFRSYLPLTLH